ncbi:hypothetical protein QTP88_024792 [Uroleucon formosanum]
MAKLTKCSMPVSNLIPDQTSMAILKSGPNSYASPKNVQIADTPGRCGRLSSNIYRQNNGIPLYLSIVRLRHKDLPPTSTRTSATKLHRQAAEQRRPSSAVTPLLRTEVLAQVQQSQCLKRQRIRADELLSRAVSVADHSRLPPWLHGWYGRRSADARAPHGHTQRKQQTPLPASQKLTTYIVIVICYHCYCSSSTALVLLLFVLRFSVIRQSI